MERCAHLLVKFVCLWLCSWLCLKMIVELKLRDWAALETSVVDDSSDPERHLSKKVASLLGSALADQFSEVYNKGDSSITYRDSSDFQAPPPELQNVPIEGLQPYQHGYQLINTQEIQRAQKLSNFQRDTVRKQEEYLKSVLESNEGRSQRPVSNDFSGFQQQPSTLSPTTHPFRKFEPPGSDFTGHPTFNFRLQGEQKVTPSTLRTIEFNSFQTEPALISQGSGSVIQRVPQQKTSIVQPEKRPTFAFREQSTTPSYPQDVNGFGQDFLKTNFRNQPQQQQQQQQQQQSLQQQQPPQQPIQHHTDVSPQHGTFNVNRRPVPSTDNQQRFTEIRTSGDEQSIVRPDLDTLQRLPLPETPALSDFQSGEEEEARFISQVNQNTAAGASQISSFRQAPQLNDFNALPTAPARAPSTRRPISQNLPQDDTFGKRTKLVTQPTRKPVVPVTDRSQFGFVSTPVSPLPDVPRQRPPTRLEDENLAKSEEVDELEASKEDASVQYNFATSLSDTVNGNSQSRQEVRDGLKLTGMYSFSDGFFKRTVFYEADENGYRIVKEENEPIGKGPVYNPNGEVLVNYQHDGNSLKYKIHGDQFKIRPTVNKKTPVITSGGIGYDEQLQPPS